MTRVKQPYQIVLVVFVLFLLWLVLFKLSSDPLSVIANYHSRSLNLVPFAGFSPLTGREMLDNLIVFVPLGLLLGICFKNVGLWRKLAWIFMLSAGAEIMQYVFAIGTTDITDTMMNTLGGLLGLAAYRLVGKHIDGEKLDRSIVVTLVILLVVLTWLRFAVFRVKY